MEKITLGNYSVKVLDPKILVFENVIEDPDGLINFYEENVKWGGWHGFGKQSEEDSDQLGPLDHFPQEGEWEEKLLGKSPDNPYRDKMYRDFIELSRLYVDYTGTHLKNWITGQWSLAKYTPDVDHINNPKQSMGHHTDYQQDRYGQPGIKFGITSVFYPNDDYEGGEISFKVLDLETFTVKKEINYKPIKGEAIFFPSTEPYYHGVLRVWGNPKYIIRMYWDWEDPGTEAWHALRKKYGNEKFEELEAARIRRHDLSVYDPVQRPLLTFEEYYELLESGELPPYLVDEENHQLNELREKKIKEGLRAYDI